MALLINKLFSSKRKPYGKHEDVCERAFTFSKEQVRIVLFRECDFRGRKLLFDSQTVQKVAMSSAGVGKLSTPCAATNNKNEVYAEISNGFGYQYTRPSGDTVHLGETVFGSVAMSFRGTSFKIHSFSSPSKLMCTQVFPSPRTSGKGRVSITTNLFPMQQSTTSFQSLEKSVKLDYSSASSTTSFNEHVSSPSIDSDIKIIPCNGSVPLDVPINNVPNCKVPSPEGDSGFCGQSYSSLSSGPYSTGPHLEFVPGPALSCGSLYKRWLRSASTSLDYTSGSQSSLTGARVSASADDCVLRSQHRSSKLGLAVIVQLTEGQEYDMESFLLKHAALVEAAVCRAATSASSAYARPGSFASLMYDIYTEVCQWLCSLLTGPTLQTYLWHDISHITPNPPVRSHFRTTLANITSKLTVNHQMKSTKSNNSLLDFVLKTKSESSLTRVSSSSDISKSSRTSVIGSSTGEVGRFLDGGFKASVHRSLSGLGRSDIVNKLDRQSDSVNVAACKSSVYAEDFVKELCELLESVDVKHTNFFISTLLTAVLTHHLGWVSTVYPPSQGDKDLISKLPSPCNPLWGQLTDLYGAVGHPTKMSRTIVCGNNNGEIINKILNILTYFIRCSSVEKNTLKDFSISDLNIKPENKLIEKKNENVKMSVKISNRFKEIHQNKQPIEDLEMCTLKLPENGISDENMFKPKGLKKNKSNLGDLFLESDYLSCNNNNLETMNEYCKRKEDDMKVVFVLGESDELVDLKKTLDEPLISTSPDILNIPSSSQKRPTELKLPNKVLFNCLSSDSSPDDSSSSNCIDTCADLSPCSECEKIQRSSSLQPGSSKETDTKIIQTRSSTITLEQEFGKDVIEDNNSSSNCIGTCVDLSPCSECEKVRHRSCSLQPGGSKETNTKIIKTRSSTITLEQEFGKDVIEDNNSSYNCIGTCVDLSPCSECEKVHHRSCSLQPEGSKETDTKIIQTRSSTITLEQEFGKDDSSPCSECEKVRHQSCSLQPGGSKETDTKIIQTRSSTITLEQEFGKDVIEDNNSSSNCIGTCADLSPCSECEKVRHRSCSLQPGGSKETDTKIIQTRSSKIITLEQEFGKDVIEDNNSSSNCIGTCVDLSPCSECEKVRHRSCSLQPGGSKEADTKIIQTRSSKIITLEQEFGKDVIEDNNSSYNCIGTCVDLSPCSECEKVRQRSCSLQPGGSKETDTKIIQTRSSKIITLEQEFGKDVIEDNNSSSNCIGTCVDLSPCSECEKVRHRSCSLQPGGSKEADTKIIQTRSSKIITLEQEFGKDVIEDNNSSSNCIGTCVDLSPCSECEKVRHRSCSLQPGGSKEADTKIIQTRSSKIITLEQEFGKDVIEDNNSSYNCIGTCVDLSPCSECEKVRQRSCSLQPGGSKETDTKIIQTRSSKIITLEQEFGKDVIEDNNSSSNCIGTCVDLSPCSECEKVRHRSCSLQPGGSKEADTKIIQTRSSKIITLEQEFGKDVIEDNNSSYNCIGTCVDLSPCSECEKVRHRSCSLQPGGSKEADTKITQTRSKIITLEQEFGKDVIELRRREGFDRSQSVPPSDKNKRKCSKSGCKKKYSGVKFDIRQYPQIVTNYMKSKDLELSQLPFGDKVFKLNRSFSTTLYDNCVKYDFPSCDCEPHDSEALQTPSNASELEFTSDLNTDNYDSHQSQAKKLSRSSKDDVLKGVGECATSLRVKSDSAVHPLQEHSCSDSENNVIFEHDAGSYEKKTQVRQPSLKMVYIDLPLPSIEVEKPVKTNPCTGYTHSLLRGVGSRYISDMVLQGTTCPTKSWEHILKRDLTLSARQPLLDQPIQEAVAIVANTDTWEVQLVSSHSYVVERGCLGVRVCLSQLVANMLESLLHMWKLRTPSEYCLMHIEARLREFYLHSKTLAQLLMSTEFCSMEVLTSALQLEVNDIPLLMAAASTHTPQVTSKYGLSFQ